MIKYIFLKLSLLFVVTTTIVHAQSKSWETTTKENFKSMLDEVSNFYKNQTHYSFDIRHSSFKDKNDTQPFESSNGYMKKSGNSYHSLLMGVQTIQNNRYKVSVDKINEMIMFSDAEELLSPWDEYNKEGSMEMVMKVEKRMLNSGDVQYKAIYQDGLGVDYLIIEKNKAGWTNELIICYEDRLYEDQETRIQEKVAPMVKVKYTNFTQDKVGPSEFDVSKFVLINGKSVTPTSAYQNFSFYDARQPK